VPDDCGTGVVDITRSALLDLQLILLRASLAEDEDAKRTAAIT
jgi:hypothetical protein